MLQLTFFIQRSWITETFRPSCFLQFESKMFCWSHFLRRRNHVSWKTTNFAFVKWFLGEICWRRGSGWLIGGESCFNVNLKSGIYGVMIRRVGQTFAIVLRKDFPIVPELEWIYWRMLLCYRNRVKKTLQHVHCLKFQFFLKKELRGWILYLVMSFKAAEKLKDD